MSLETDLVAVLRGVCPRSYPDVAPAGTALPYVTWQQIGGDAPIYVEGAVTNRENALIQIDAWCATRLEAKTLIKQIEAALVTSGLQAVPQGAARASYSEDEDLRGYMQDFSVWALR